VSLAENGVVDLLADTIKHSDIVVGILGTAVALDGFITGIAQHIELVEERGQDNIIGIEYDDMVELTSHFVDGILHGFGLRALLEGGLEQTNREVGQQLVGLRLHVVGDDGDRVMVLRVVLFDELLYGVDDDAVFVVGGIQNQEPTQVVADQMGGTVICKSVILIIEQRDNGKEADIRRGSGDYQPKGDVDIVNDGPNHRVG
jgi:hypothetical protein